MQTVAWPTRPTLARRSHCSRLKTTVSLTQGVGSRTSNRRVRDGRTSPDIWRRDRRGPRSELLGSTLPAARSGVWDIFIAGGRQRLRSIGCRPVRSDQVRRSDELPEMSALRLNRLSASPGDRAAVLPALHRPRADPGAHGNLDSAVHGYAEPPATQIPLLGPAASRTRAWSQCSCGPATDHLSEAASAGCRALSSGSVTDVPSRPRAGSRHCRRLHDKACATARR